MMLRAVLARSALSTVYVHARIGGWTAARKRAVRLRRAA